VKHNFLVSKLICEKLFDYQDFYLQIGKALVFIKYCLDFAFKIRRD